MQAGLVLLGGFLGCCRGERIPVPNGSFELPGTEFVSTRIVSWEELPKPPEYPEGGGFAWDQLTGVFRNTLPGAADHLANLDGNQALYLFAIPGVGVFQDATSRDWDDVAPSGDFAPRFDVGTSIRLEAAVQGGGGNMLEGVGLEIGLYYRDDLGAIQLVASTNVIHDVDDFADRSRLVDVGVVVPEIRAADLWANRPLGILLRSTVTDAMKGGYWDIDTLRLSRFRVDSVPLTAVFVPDLGGLQVSWHATDAVMYSVETSFNLKDWSAQVPEIVGKEGPAHVVVATPEEGPLFVRLRVEMPL